MQKIRKAVIPAAGLGTRVLPATKAMPKEMLPIVDKPAIQYIVEEAVAAGIAERTRIGTIVSRDHFYFTPQGQTEALARYGTLCVEMEAAALYAVAAEYGGRALAVLTVSDHLLDHSRDMSAAERETRFADSLRLAVAAALS